MRYPWEINQFDLMRKWVREIERLSMQLPHAYSEMANLTGLKALLLPRRYEGEPCPNLKERLQIHTHHDCPICFGTGIVGGYDDPIEINVIPIEQQMIIQWRSWGYTPENSYNFLIPGTFTVKTEDVLVLTLDNFRKYYDFKGAESWDYEDVRFSIIRVNPFFLRKTIAYFDVTARLLPEDHVIYNKHLTPQISEEGAHERFDHLPDKTRPIPTAFAGGADSYMGGDIWPEDDNWYEGYVRVD